MRVEVVGVVQTPQAGIEGVLGSVQTPRLRLGCARCCTDPQAEAVQIPQAEIGGLRVVYRPPRPESGLSQVRHRSIRWR